MTLSLDTLKMGNGRDREKENLESGHSTFFKKFFSSIRIKLCRNNVSPLLSPYNYHVIFVMFRKYWYLVALVTRVYVREPFFVKNLTLELRAHNINYAAYGLAKRSASIFTKW